MGRARAFSIESGGDAVTEQPVPYLAQRSWWCGLHRCTLSVLRPKPGRDAAVTLRWSPHEPKHLSVEDLRDFRQGCRAVLATVQARWGVRADVHSPFFSTGAAK